MPFDTKRSVADSGVVVLTLTGTMTMGTQLQRFEWLVEEIVKEQKNRVVADLSGISYMDSSAIGVLIACQSALKNAGGQLRLAGVTERVAKIFKLAGVHGVLPVDVNQEASIAALAAGA